MDPVEPATPAEPVTPAEPKAPAEPKEDKPKVVPLSEHIELRNRAKAAETRLKELEAAEEERERAKLSEVERARKEVEDLKKANQDLVVSQARTKAFMNAKTKIGDNFTLDGVEDKLWQKIEKLTYDPETFDADVFDLVDMAKKPRSAGAGVVPRGGTGPVGVKKATEYTHQELAKLEKEDKATFQRVIAERNAATGFNTVPYGTARKQPT